MSQSGQIPQLGVNVKTKILWKPPPNYSSFSTPIVIQEPSSNHTLKAEPQQV